MGATFSRRLADYLAGLRFENIPQEAVDQVKRLTLHVIGASIGALPIRQTRKLIDYTQTKGGKPEATIWGSDGRKVPVQEAAFANGTMADIMDWEDCSWTGHPSAGAIPVALAMGEARFMPGRDYITAVVAAYEGYQRIAMAAQPSRAYIVSGQGWGLVSWQVYSASIAAGKALGLSADEMDQVFGASLYNAIVSCNKHSEGSAKSDIYHYAHGFCARNGVVAAELTRLGFDNCRGSLDGNDGFWHMVSDQVDWDWHVKELGKRWLICETYLKHWPANMWVQTPLEALDLLMKKHPFEMDDVVKIRVSPHVPFICGDYSKTTRGTLDAQFSIPYCLSAYIMDHRMGAQWFNEEMRNNEKLIEFTKKFEYHGETRVPNDNFDEFKTGSFPEIGLEVTLKDGTSLSHTMRYPKGHPRNNFTMDEQRDHFRLCCEPYMESDQIERIIEIVGSLENLQNIGELASLTAIR
jgi:2-methylcitrate dehydratase PrpD